MLYVSSVASPTKAYKLNETIYDKIGITDTKTGKETFYTNQQVYKLLKSDGLNIYGTYCYGADKYNMYVFATPQEFNVSVSRSKLKELFVVNKKQHNKWSLYPIADYLASLKVGSSISIEFTDYSEGSGNTFTDTVAIEKVDDDLWYQSEGFWGDKNIDSYEAANSLDYPSCTNNYRLSVKENKPKATLKLVKTEVGRVVSIFIRDLVYNGKVLGYRVEFVQTTDDGILLNISKEGSTSVVEKENGGDLVPLVALDTCTLQKQEILNAIKTTFDAVKISQGTPEVGKIDVETGAYLFDEDRFLIPPVEVKSVKDLKGKLESIYTSRVNFVNFWNKVLEDPYKNIKSILAPVQDTFTWEEAGVYTGSYEIVCYLGLNTKQPLKEVQNTLNKHIKSLGYNVRTIVDYEGDGWFSILFY